MNPAIALDATPTNSKVAFDRDVSGLLHQMAALKLARHQLISILSDATEYHIQRIPVTTAERDDQGNCTPIISDDTFLPENIGLKEALNGMYSFEAPNNRMTNSLIRHTGYIQCEGDAFLMAIKAAKAFNEAKEQFKQLSNELAIRHFLPKGKTRIEKGEWHPNFHLREAGIFENENYEMLMRHCVFAEEPVEKIKQQWITSNYSQPKKLAVGDFIEWLEQNPKIREFSQWQWEVLQAAKALPDHAMLAKRFYLPPYPIARIRLKGEKKWEKQIHVNSPIILNATATIKMSSVELKPLCASFANGEYHIERINNRILEPKPLRLHPHLRWYIL